MLNHTQIKELLEHCKEHGGASLDWTGAFNIQHKSYSHYQGRFIVAYAQPQAKIYLGDNDFTTSLLLEGVFQGFMRSSDKDVGLWINNGYLWIENIRAFHSLASASLFVDRQSQASMYDLKTKKVLETKNTHIMLEIRRFGASTVTYYPKTMTMAFHIMASEKLKQHIKPLLHLQSHDIEHDTTHCETIEHYAIDNIKEDVL